MTRNIITMAIAIMSIQLLITSCRKNIVNEDLQSENCWSVDNNVLLNESTADRGATIGQVPLSLTIYNPCCQEEVHLIGVIHRVDNTNVIHMDSRDISGVGLSTGLLYTVQSTSVRNYVLDPNGYQTTLNWSVRMSSENGCGYIVQFVIHVTYDENGGIKASVHSGNFFCL